MAITNYYVSPTGVAGNTGTSASPWDLATGINHLGPDIQVNLLPGNYQSNELDIYNGALSGTSGHPAILKSTVKWGAIFANSANGGGIDINNVQWLVIDGLVIRGAKLGTGLGLGSSNLVARNCWVADNWQQGILTNGVNNLIENCLVENNGLQAAGQPTVHFYHGIYFQGSNGVIRNNVIRRNNNGYGIQFATSQSGLLQSNVQIYNNLIYGHPRFGAILWARDDTGGSGSGTLGTTFFFNNTVLDGIDVRWGVHTIYSNIILPSLAFPGNAIQVVNDPALTTVVEDYNLGSGPMGYGGVHDVVAVTPGLVNIAKGLGWLTVTSAARAAANPSNIPPVDFFGNVMASVSDIGFAQYTFTLASDNRTLDPSPVGGADYWAVLSPPPIDVVITTSPANTLVQVGQTATFSVVATGLSALSYQWKFNGVNVGSNVASYARSNCQLVDSGGAVTVVVTDNSGSKVSSTAILTVVSPPPPPPPPPPPVDVVISKQPQNQSVNVGSAATFSVTATGNTTLSYAWKVNGIAVGTNSSSYTRNNCQLSDSGDIIIVVVTDVSGSVTSQPASLIVASPPPPSVDIVITSEPASQIIIVGQNATFSVSATGGTTLGYQWLVNAAPVGTNSPTYVRTNVQLSDTGAVVAVLISDASGSVVSNAATLTVNPLPPPPTPTPPPPVPDIVIFVQPQNQFVQVGATAAFSVTALGAAALIYTWTFNGSVVSTGASPVFRKANCQLSDNAGTVVVTVTDVLGLATVKSGTAILTVTAVPVPKSAVSGVIAQSVGANTPVATVALVQPRNVVSVPPQSPVYKMTVSNP